MHAEEVMDLGSESQDESYRYQLSSTASTSVKSKRFQAAVDAYVEYRDRSPEARWHRKKMLIRAVYGEFICSFMFYSFVFSFFTNAYLSNWPAEYTSFLGAFVNGFMATALAFAFSSVSGAQVNPAISFALWITGKSSTRRFSCYLFVQFLASILAVLLVECMFEGGQHSISHNLMVLPRNKHDISAFFLSEFCLTFALTFMAFTVAFEDADINKTEHLSLDGISQAKGLTLYYSTPQSKTGFAPLAIGFTVFSLNLVGGNSNNAFNPARIFGPAVFSGDWTYLYYYWIAEFLGAAIAALMVHHSQKWGLKTTSTGLSMNTAGSASKEMKRREEDAQEIVNRRIIDSHHFQHEDDDEEEEKVL